MKLGDVLKKERENKELAVDEVASKLGIDTAEYEQIEAGETPAEKWGPVLAQIAIKLETPTSRLLAESGRFEDTKAGQAGGLIKGHRERRELSTAEVAEYAEISEDEYKEIEAGKSDVYRFTAHMQAAFGYSLALAPQLLIGFRGTIAGNHFECSSAAGHFAHRMQQIQQCRIDRMPVPRSKIAQKVVDFIQCIR